MMDVCIVEGTESTIELEEALDRSFQVGREEPFKVLYFLKSTEKREKFMCIVQKYKSLLPAVTSNELTQYQSPLCYMLMIEHPLHKGESINDVLATANKHLEMALAEYDIHQV